MSLHTVIWHNLNYCFIFTIVSLTVMLLCVYMYYTNVFIPYLNVWQAMMFCAMCLFELIKKCLILSYLYLRFYQLSLQVVVAEILVMTAHDAWGRSR